MALLRVGVENQFRQSALLRKKNNFIAFKISQLIANEEINRWREKWVDRKHPPLLMVN